MIGVDFDNTIVCYDGVFDAAARERGVIDSGPPRTKGELRDELRAQDREDEWTELQGYVYGPGMELAHPFDGALDFLGAAGPDLAIVSHRTRHPYAGPRYDLHAAARDWLERQQVALPTEAVHLVETREEKFERIRSLDCTLFIDDLPEFLTDPAFPEGVERVLFDPHGAGAPDGVRPLTSWRKAAELLP